MATTGYCEMCGAEGRVVRWIDRGNGDRYDLCPGCAAIRRAG